MTACQQVKARIAAAERVWWFLDYDGTLADFAPNPDVIVPDPALIALVTALAADEQMRVTIISGRRLAHIEQLLPIDGIIQAGSYGLEVRLESGERQHPIALAEIRPILDTLKPEWAALLAGRDGFYLEDKGWTLAVHAKDAAAEEGESVIGQARAVAEQTIAGQHADRFRLLGGHRFLEIGPRAASKRRTVTAILAEHAWPGALPVYLGDDDKDAVAFAVVQAQGGFAVGVGERAAVDSADCRLPSPAAARRWLRSFI